MSALQREWRRIPWAPHYEVSNDGLVASWRPYRNFAPPPKERRILKPNRDKDGYARVGFYVDGVLQSWRVCRLVGMVWLGTPPDGFVIRHLDGSKDNDTVENLVWGTPKENSLDSQAHGTWVHGDRVNTSKMTSDQVRDVLKSDKSHAELARQYGVTPCAIWHIRAGRTWKWLQAQKTC